MTASKKLGDATGHDAKFIVPKVCEDASKRALHRLAVLQRTGALSAGAVHKFKTLLDPRRPLILVEPITCELRKRLADGSVRLLRGAWLVGDDADAVFPREPSTGAAVLVRRQELPEDAFVPCDEAAELLDSGERAILVLSYAWMTPKHPDPFGECGVALRVTFPLAHTPHSLESLSTQALR